MKFPKTADDVYNEIILSSAKSKELGNLRIRQLIHILPKVVPEIIVEGIIRVFENDNGPDGNSQNQEFAGKVLEEINPRPEKSATEILVRVLKNWDKSIEQFPFWLEKNYTLEQLKKAFAELNLNALEKDKLTTIKWWINFDKKNGIG